MSNLAQLGGTLFDTGQWLRRKVWQPLRRMMTIFNVVPLTGGIVVFLLLATDGQVRELYLSYLEDLLAPGRATIAMFAMPLLGLALISAVLYEAHYWLSTLRIGVVYSSVSNPEYGSALYSLQRMAAVALALVPWFGAALGLIHANQYLVSTAGQLADPELKANKIVGGMKYDAPSGSLVIVSAIVLAFAVAWFLDRYRRHPGLLIIGVAIIPIAAGELFLLMNATRADRDLSIGDIAPAVALLGVLYYIAYYRFYTMRTSVIYAHPLYPDTGINRERRRRIALFIWAALPWIAIGGYYYTTPPGPQLIGPQAVVPLAICWVATAGLFLSTLLDSFRENMRLQWGIVVCVVASAVGAEAVSWFGADTVVSFYRGIGPLGTMTLGLVFVFSTFTLIAVLSQKSGFPVLMLIIFAIVIDTIFPIRAELMAAAIALIGIVFVGMALLSRLWAVAAVAALLVAPGIINMGQRSPALKPNPPQMNGGLQSSFGSWIATRPGIASATAENKYPVFIIAAEGGGIYAGAAVSLFMSKLEEIHPGFSQHVFAISAVSGGAIGSAVFQALDTPTAAPSGVKSAATLAAVPDNPTAPDGTRPCRPIDASLVHNTASAQLSQTVLDIMQDDHFSPIVGAIFPEMFGGSSMTRAKVLAESFRSSVYTRDHAAANKLESCFAEHWSPDSGPPALVLNATWVETGFRVAYSPFLLNPIDKTMYSFLDKDMPADPSMTLIDAALVSARFPGILPPYSVVIQSQAGKQRWNFADGGYADSTGASTALSLYNALYKSADQNNALLRVVLITSSDPQPDPTGENGLINGTAFRDTLAPVSAVMQVREGLGNQAVSRACVAFYKDNNCRELAQAPKAPLMLVDIDDALYNLPMGWKLSRTTFGVVNLMLGGAEFCKEGSAPSAVNPPSAVNVTPAAITVPASDPDDKGNGGQSKTDPSERNKQARQNNSCVLAHIAALLNPGVAPAQ
jgi:hypothetical protein